MTETKRSICIDSYQKLEEKRMEKQEIILKFDEDKKHSVRYKPSSIDAAITAIYVMRRCMGSSVPKTIKVTIEEV